LPRVCPLSSSAVYWHEKGYRALFSCTYSIPMSKRIIKKHVGQGESKEESQKRRGKGACERRIPEAHLKSKAARSTNTSNTSTLLPPSLPGSPSAGLGAWLLSKV